MLILILFTNIPFKFFKICNGLQGHSLRIYWQPFEFPYFIWKLKVRFFVNCTKFSNHYDFLNIKKSQYCRKATAEWNIKVENILDKRRIKTQKNEDENSQFFT